MRFKPYKEVLLKHISGNVPAATLALFRILFGFIMLVSIIRFASNGWIYSQYIKPDFFFTYYGFGWVQPLGDPGMYILFSLMGLAALGIMLGSFYRISATLFFLVFTYTELIDKTNYLNHYYFVSLVSFLLILVPAHRYFSVDVLRKPQIKIANTPVWTINIFKLQLGIVYFYAGLAKLNYDWLFNAMPLKIWLPSRIHLPLLGPLFALPETAYFFSWAGAIYDLTVVFFLLYKRTRIWAYLTVVIFHMMTWWLFQIGMFPFIMILSTLIFFSPEFHEKIIAGLRYTWQQTLGRFIGETETNTYIPSGKYSLNKVSGRLLTAFFVVYFVLQLALPFRYLLYPGNLFWNEEGYRFSWRVMLMEKAGYTTFTVSDKHSDRSWQIANWEYLTPVQEKMMSTQPDMILQFAHHVEEIYRQKGYEDVEVSARALVTLNGRRIRPLIDSTVDLTEKEPGLSHKNWIIPFKNDNTTYADR